MAEKSSFKCPVCGKPLSQTEYYQALGLWEEKQAHIKHLESERRRLREQAKQSQQKIEMERQRLRQQALSFQERERKLREQTRKALAEQERRSEQRLRQQRAQIEKTLQKQMQAQVKLGIEKGMAEQKAMIKKQEAELQKSKNKMAQLERSLRSSATKYEQANAEIKRLREQIEKGITPQIEGLLEEDNLLARLVELFPQDKFTHPGKGGDIVQVVIEHGKEVGKIVYECKKVKRFDRKHVDQAKEARRSREADFAILVTNAFPSKKQYYFVERTVFVISPISLEPITQTLRDSLVRIFTLRLSNEAKSRAVQQIYDYLSSNEYSNKVNDVANQLLDLGRELKNEMVSHKRVWEKRYRLYSALFDDIGVIDSKLRSMIQSLSGNKPKLLSAPKKEYIEIKELES